VLALPAGASAATPDTIGIIATTPAMCPAGLTDRVPLGEVGQYTVHNYGGALNSWRMTSWSYNAPPSASPVTMKVFRMLGPSFYEVEAHDGPRPVAGGLLNVFPVDITVSAGDLLGLNTQGTNACTSVGSPGPHLTSSGSLNDKSSTFFTTTATGALNVTATLVPTNTFTIRRAKPKPKKGTAILPVDVPNGGDLVASGKGVRSARAAVISKTTTALPGLVNLLIKAKGKQRRKLDATGKVTLRPRITYTPFRGDPNVLSTKLTLLKR
jgi:hypothetical protein